METIAERIVQRRKALGMTQKELAEKLNVSDKTLSRWETGKQIPDALTLLEISNALGMTISEMYGAREGEKSDSDIPVTTQEGVACKNSSRKRLKLVGAGILAIAVIVGLVIGGVNWKLRSEVAYTVEDVSMYKLTSYDYSVLEWIKACDEGTEEMYLLSRLKTDTETGQDIVCYLVYIPRGCEDTEAFIRYRLGLRGKVLEFNFKNTTEITDDNYCLCYVEAVYYQEESLYLQTYLDGKLVDHSSQGNMMNVNWEDFFLEKIFEL